MFPWHSTVVEPAKPLARAGEDQAQRSSSNNVDPSSSAAQRLIETAYRALIDAGAGLERNGSGAIVNPAPLLAALASEGVRLGPEGSGTLLALCDRVPIRPPTLDEFSRCCLKPGATLGLPPPPSFNASAERGRGLGHLCAGRTQSMASGRGRGAIPQGARGRGVSNASLGASLGRGRGMARGGASMR